MATMDHCCGSSSNDYLYCYLCEVDDNRVSKTANRASRTSTTARSRRRKTTSIWWWYDVQVRQLLRLGCKITIRPTMDPSFFADGPPVAFNPEEYRTLSTLPIKPGT